MEIKLTPKFNVKIKICFIMKKPPLSNDILCDITKRSVIIRVNPRNQAIDYLPASQMLFFNRNITQINAYY